MRLRVSLLEPNMNYWNMRSVVKLFVLMALASTVHPGVEPIVDTKSDTVEEVTDVPEEIINKEETPVNSLPDIPGGHGLKPMSGNVYLDFVKNVLTKEKYDILSDCMINGTDNAPPELSEEDYRCSNRSYCFTRCERQYVDNHVPSDKEPSVTGPQCKKLQKKVYEKESRQRLFEFIGIQTNGLSTISAELNSKYLATACSCASKQPTPICDPTYKYRSFDGTCNNLLFPKRGSVLSCLQRFVTASYEGVSGFRKSVCGCPLPNARTTSLKVYLDKNRPTKKMSHMLPFYGQFVAHDITDTPTSFVSTKPIDCCSECGKKKQHPQCAPICIKEDDPFYSQFNVTCFNFVRAAPCDTCDIGKRNQMNQETSYIDLSHVYGLNDKKAKGLRSKDEKGKLKYQNKNGEELLPANPNAGIPGDCGLNNEPCFDAGDRRVNMHTPLMGLHTLFLREHNRLAEDLSKLNPTWDDETLYQEARRIVIAVFQFITYNEYLPMLFQPYIIAIFGLYTTVPSVYIPAVDATGWAEVNGAAYRLHSALNGIVAEQGVEAKNRLLRNNFNNAEPLYSGNMSSLMNGICQFPAQKNDKFVTKEMTDYLYKTLKGSYGFDIVAFNIQRGRDCGLPTYVRMVEFWTVGTVVIKTFDQLSVYMDESSIKIMKEIYCDVNDIDLWVGLNHERPDGDTLLGPTAAKMVAFQFYAMKFGDRFFFQHDSKQLAVVKKASFAGLLCRNTNITKIQRDAFKKVSDTNPIVDCKDIIDELDLSLI